LDLLLASLVNQIKSEVQEALVETKFTPSQNQGAVIALYLDEVTGVAQMQVKLFLGFEFEFTVDTGARLWALGLDMLKKVKNGESLVLVGFTVVLAGERRVDLFKLINC